MAKHAWSRRRLALAGTILLWGAASAAAPQTAAPAPPGGAAQEAPASTATGLSDLAAVTFSCPQAGLNAAAREAAKAPSEGTYQFSYFNIISDAHHAAYEVHFKSNYEGEPVLKYCVALYCQQGWDPRTTPTTVTLMPDAPTGRRGRATAHDAPCGMAAAARPGTVRGGRR